MLDGFSKRPIGEIGESKRQNNLGNFIESPSVLVWRSAEGSAERSVGRQHPVLVSEPLRIDSFVRRGWNSGGWNFPGGAIFQPTAILARARACVRARPCKNNNRLETRSRFHSSCFPETCFLLSLPVFPLIRQLSFRVSLLHSLPLSSLPRVITRSCVSFVLLFILYSLSLSLSARFLRFALVLVTSGREPFELG